jgi:hypothetical protein
VKKCKLLETVKGRNHSIHLNQPPFSPMYSAKPGFRDLSAKGKFLAVSA